MAESDEEGELCLDARARGPPADLAASMQGGGGGDGELRRSISMWSGVALILGTMIGSGIFASPGSVLLHSSTVGMSLTAWATAGFLSLLGASAYIELGTCLPESGAEYVYISRSYGAVAGFLYTWTTCLVTKPVSLAIIAVVCAEYAIKPAFEEGEPEWLANVVGVVIVVVITALNCVSVRLAVKVTDVFTVLKVIALTLIIGAGMVQLARTASDPSSVAGRNLHQGFRGSNAKVSQFALSVVAGLWSYDGWNNLNYVIEELRDPLRNLPRAIFVGLPLVTLLYVLTNLSYYAVLPLNEIVDRAHGRTREGFVSSFGEEAMGQFGRYFLPVCIVISAFGAANGSAFTGGRLVYVSARSGHFPKFLMGVYKSTASADPAPVAGLLMQGALAVVMVVSGNFDQLVNYFSVAAWIFYFLSVSSVLVLRWREPNLERPFRVWLPVPIVFCAIALSLVASIIVEEPKESAIAISCILTGVPAFFLKERCPGWAAQPAVSAKYRPLSNDTVGDDNSDWEL